MPAKVNEREYRDFTLAVIEAPDTDDNNNRIVRGYASTFNQPYTLYSDDVLEIREQVAPEAFKDADMSDVIMQYDHEGRVFARMSNGTLKVAPDEEGLSIEADLGHTEIGRQLYEEIKGGYTTKMSYGYIVSDAKWDRAKVDGKDIQTRTITGIKKVFDVSAVSLPANNATSISVRKLTDGVIEELEAERLKALELERRRTLLKIKTMEV